MNRITNPNDLPDPPPPRTRAPVRTPGPRRAPTDVPAPSYAIAQQGKPIPICWGTNKVGIILLEMFGDPVAYSALTYNPWVAATKYGVGDFVYNSGNTYVCTIKGTSAGAGGPSGTTKGIVDNTVTWDYVTTGAATLYWQSFVAAICEGEASQPDWSNAPDTLYWDKIQVSPAGLDSQLAIAPLWTPGYDVPGRNFSPGDRGYYNHVALMYGETIPSGSQREMPSVAVEFQGQRFGASGSYDCNPADIVVDLLTHCRRGVAWSSARLDASISGAAATSFRTYCDAHGIRFSMLVDAQKPALEVLTDVLNATNSVAYWYGGKLVIAPLGDLANTSPTYGSVSYQPPASTFDFDSSLGHFLEPIRVSCRRDADCFNVVPVQYCDRAQGYAQTVVEDPDQSDVSLRDVQRGPVVALPVTFNDGTVPVMLSSILAKRSAHVRATFTWRTSWQAGVKRHLAEIVTLTEPSMGLTKKTVRITEISEDESETFTITAEEYVQGTGSATGYAPQTNDALPVNVLSTLASHP